MPNRGAQTARTSKHGRKRVMGTDITSNALQKGRKRMARLRLDWVDEESTTRVTVCDVSYTLPSSARACHHDPSLNRLGQRKRYGQSSSQRQWVNVKSGHVGESSRSYRNPPGPRHHTASLLPPPPPTPHLESCLTLYQPPIQEYTS